MIAMPGITAIDAQALWQPFMPKAYLNGFPKSGLHLAEQMLGVMLRPAELPNWLGNLSGYAWKLQESFPPEYIAQKLNDAPGGTYYKGHMYFRDEISRSFVEQNIATFLVVRDMRDVVVSQAHHVLNDDPDLRHAGKSIYQSLSTFEEVLIAVIEGIDDYPGIFDRWRHFGLWLGHPRLFLLRFEDMRYHPRRVAGRVIQWLAERVEGQIGLTPNEKQLRRIARNAEKSMKMRELSVTFRKGQAGGWRDAFTPRVKDSFLAHSDGWLCWMGYEEDGEW